MKLSELLKLVVEESATNFFVVAPDQLGLVALLPKSLREVAAKSDIHVVDAAALSKDRARGLEKEARYAPHGSSEKTHFLVYGLQNLETACIGPLLKVVEESQYARWIFQAQYIPKRINTLKSRSWVIKVPFLPKKTVLGNLKRMNLDTTVVEKAGLYDGTLTGTAKALNMKDTLGNLRKAIKEGDRGLVTLFSQESLNSLAFSAAVLEQVSMKERRFLERDNSDERKKLVLWTLSQRV